MNVCLRPYPFLSRSLERIASALDRYAPPGVTVVPRHLADFVVYPVVGTGSLPSIDEDLAAGRPYAMVQCCVETTDDPTGAAFLPYWQLAKAVWSYLDLVKFDSTLDFYHAPLGVDHEVFRRRNYGPRPYLLATTGYVAETEHLQECADAVAALGGRMIHMGSKTLNLGPHVDCVENISDAQWADLLNQSKYVAGLRRTEGFELPLLEGACCGAKPITLNLTCYRQWFGWHARYVRVDAVDTDLRYHLTNSARSRWGQEASVDPRFDWRTIAEGLWSRIQ